MATNSTKKRDIRYFNRDFDGLKKDFVEHLRIYFPDIYQDFNESSIGMMLTEMAAYFGDNLSFYLDKKFAESFLETARERKNVFKHAKQLGFKSFGKAAAAGVGDGFIRVPAIRSNQKIIPDMRYAVTIKKGAKIKGSSGQTYETLEDIEFDRVDISDDAFVQVGDRDASTKEPKNFILKRSKVPIKAGETKSVTFAVTSYKAFRKLTINEENVLEIIDVRDSSGNIWYEVDFLAQDTVFDGVANTGESATDVPYVLTLRSVPYRFTTEYDVTTQKMSLIFGSGDAQNFDGQLIPDLGDLSLPTYGKSTFTDFAIDPQNFLKTRTLGLAPVNTTLTVRYRVGGGVDTNAGSGEVKQVSDSQHDIGDTTLNSDTVNDVGNSFSFSNPEAILGGKDELTLDEIRQLIAANFAAQSRVVTSQDFVVRTLSMPSKFGSIFRANARVNPVNSNAVELIVISKDSTGHAAVAPSDLKENLRKYLSRFRMLTDAIDILDGQIINVAINFQVLTNPDFVKSEVLTNCIQSLKEFFEIDKWQINQPINRTDVIRVLASVPGVLSVFNLNIINRAGNFEGRSYSATTYNISENSKNGITYCKDNAIFEVKYLGKDISGVAI